jgi:hypothetical protein
MPEKFSGMTTGRVLRAFRFIYFFFKLKYLIKIKIKTLPDLPDLPVKKSIRYAREIQFENLMSLLVMNTHKATRSTNDDSPNI